VDIADDKIVIAVPVLGKLEVRVRVRVRVRNGSVLIQVWQHKKVDNTSYPKVWHWSSGG
jgi:hypothetical protein